MLESRQCRQIDKSRQPEAALFASRYDHDSGVGVSTTGPTARLWKHDRHRCVMSVCDVWPHPKQDYRETRMIESFETEVVMTNKNVALIVGASGVVGGHLAALLANQAHWSVLGLSPPWRSEGRHHAHRSRPAEQRTRWPLRWLTKRRRMSS